MTVSNRASGTQEELTAYKASNDKALEDAKTELSNALNEYAEVVDNDLISIHEAIDGLGFLGVVLVYIFKVKEQPVAWQCAHNEPAIVIKEIASVCLYGDIVFYVLLLYLVPVVTLKEHYYGSLANDYYARQSKQENNKQVEAENNVVAELERFLSVLL